MAVQDTSRKPYLVDNDSNIKVGLSLPLRREDASDGWFATTSTTIEAVKNNIVNLCRTNTGCFYWNLFRSDKCCCSLGYRRSTRA